MFTTNHFIWIGLCIVFISALMYISEKYSFSFRTAAGVMAVISFISELSKILTHMVYVNGVDASDGMVIEAESLPFHLCSLMIFAFFYLPFCKNERAKSFLVGFIAPVGFFGAVLAILIATSGTSFTNPEVYQCFIYHSAMLWFCLYLIKTGRADLGVKTWLTNIALLFCLVFVMIWVNGRLRVYDTNFLYVVRPPVKGLPLLNLDNGWYAYIATIIAGGLGGMTLFHLPFMIKERREKAVKVKVKSTKSYNKV